MALSEKKYSLDGAISKKYTLFKGALRKKYSLDGILSKWSEVDMIDRHKYTKMNYVVELQVRI